MTDARLLSALERLVGARHVRTGEQATERFRKGYRSGEGAALAVVRPGTLLELWQVLDACVRADKIIIMQAANTGLTEGSTPKGQYDRDAVIINTLRIDAIHTLNEGRQVVGLAGATLFKLEKLLAPLGRQPHSVIGSSCIGASVIGGVCNNSGGSLVERGPSYTELALFAQVTADGRLELVNHLGLDLGSTPEEMLTRLEAGEFTFSATDASHRKASDTDYAARVRDVDADTPARFNADTRRLFEASGCAGKLAVFAVRLDTYPMNAVEQTFYIGTNDTGDLTDLRRDILSGFGTLPVSAEYMHRDCFDISDRYGKDTVVMIDKLGTARLPLFFAIKGAVDARLNKWRLTHGFTDKVMQGLARVWPDILPARMRAFRDRYQHHLILKMHDGGINEAEQALERLFQGREGDYFTCDNREARIAGLHRFAAAGAAVRYQALRGHEVEEILALDIALRRNDRDWFEVLPAEIESQLVHKLYYGHFMCHVLHQDYIVRKGADVAALKTGMMELLDARGAECPAEHNVGHLYVAKPGLAAHYCECDPTNTFNPGIGKTSRKRDYAET
ncbi:MAG: D-lactate dehydrogenase [Marinobacter sp.]